MFSSRPVALLPMSTKNEHVSAKNKDVSAKNKDEEERKGGKNK